MKLVTASSLLLLAAVGCVDNADPEAENGNMVKDALASLDEGDCVIKAVHSGQCLHIAGGSMDPGAKVQPWDCNGSGAQLFHLAPLGDGYFTIKNTVRDCPECDIRERHAHLE